MGQWRGWIERSAPSQHPFNALHTTSNTAHLLTHSPSCHYIPFPPLATTLLYIISGSVAWVDRAFGPFWAFQKGWLGWLSGVSDNALYPILFLDCLIGRYILTFSLILILIMILISTRRPLTDPPSYYPITSIELFDLRQHTDGTGGLVTDDATASASASGSGGASAGGSTGGQGLNFSLHDISDDSSSLRWAIIVSLTCVLTYLSYRGLDVVGTSPPLILPL